MSQTRASDRHYPANLLAQYELLQHLGGSERASVHLARDRVLGQVVAVKLFRGELGRDPDRVAGLYSHARAAASLGHPNIVAVYDHGAAWRAAFITMEYIAGRDLAAHLAREGALPPRRAAAIVAQVLDALAAAHGAGLAHGDLHSRNVLLRDDGDAVVLTDFGMVPGGVPAGRPGAWTTELARYRAPELTGHSAASPAADIFAAGMASGPASARRSARMIAAEG
jgi:eukaryotic-like serine/threonine-protein kinase